MSGAAASRLTPTSQERAYREGGYMHSIYQDN